MKALINDVDVSSRCIYEIKIVAGRANIESQPDASVCNLTLIGLGQEQVGQTLTISMELEPYPLIFYGTITDLTAEQSEEMEWTIAVVATGPLRNLGQYSVGILGYPQESDSSRIAAILDEIGISHTVDVTIPGNTLLAFPEGERVNAAEQARKAADDGLGVLWEDPRTGLLKYLPAKMRIWNGYEFRWEELLVWEAYPVSWKNLNSSYVFGNSELYPGEISINTSAANAVAVFEQAIGDLAKTVIVQYGIAPPPIIDEITGDEIEQPRPEIISGTGEEPQVTYDTDLAIQVEAEQYAILMVQRKQNPAWRLTQLIIHADLLSNAEWLLWRQNLIVGLRLNISFPHNSPVGYSWQGYCEGWEHLITGEAFGRRNLEVSHSITLNVSDRQLTEPSNLWREMIMPWSAIEGPWKFQ